MSDNYSEWLDAAIQYVEALKADGQRWISLPPGTLAALSTAPRGAGRRPTAAPIVARPPVPLTVAPAPAAPKPAPAPKPDPTPAPPASQLTPLAELRARTMVCELCPHLARSRKNVVFGVGDATSPLMFVGEAPGVDEDAQGEPFVGAAGQLLTRIIKAMGFTRENVYIANILKCRPDTPGQSFGNRKPTAEEMKQCLPYLLEQIRLIRPKAIVALGATAVEGLFGPGISITKARGRWRSLEATAVMPTYHPSYVLRNETPAVKREVWDDMLQVLEKLGVAITEKQRNYFKA